MAEITQISLSHQELLELLIKHNDVHDGIWNLAFTLGVGIGNFGPDPQNSHPGAVVTISQVGIKRVMPGEPTTGHGIVVADAAVINPKKAVSSKPKRSAKT